MSKKFARYSKRDYGTKVFSVNRRASFDYVILDCYEAGIALTGAEVKSVKSGHANLAESFVLIDGGEAWLWNCHISKWISTGDAQYDPLRKRKLLLTKKEISVLTGKLNQKGMTIIPLKFYARNGKIKLEIGLCRGKKMYEKSRMLRERDRALKRELYEQKREFMV